MNLSTVQPEDIISTIDYINTEIAMFPPEFKILFIRLKPNQKDFLCYYFQTLNKTDSYINAGYTSKSPASAADSLCSNGRMGELLTMYHSYRQTWLDASDGLEVTREELRLMYSARLRQPELSNRDFIALSKEIRALEGMDKSKDLAPNGLALVGMANVLSGIPKASKMLSDKPISVKNLTA